MKASSLLSSCTLLIVSGYLVEGAAVEIEAKHLKAGSMKKEIVVRNGRTDPVQFDLAVPVRP